MKYALVSMGMPLLIYITGSFKETTKRRLSEAKNQQSKGSKREESKESILGKKKEKETDFVTMSLFACTHCNGRHPFEQLSKGDQLCKVW